MFKTRENLSMWANPAKKEDKRSAETKPEMTSSLTPNNEILTTTNTLPTTDIKIEPPEIEKMPILENDIQTKKIANSQNAKPKEKIIKKKKKVHENSQVKMIKK